MYVRQEVVFYLFHQNKQTLKMKNNICAYIENIS